MLAGVPCDFRLDYGRHIGRRAVLSANRSRSDLTRNRRPTLAVLGAPDASCAARAGGGARKTWGDWLTLRATRRGRPDPDAVAGRIGRA
jgi:acetolactate synthase-1/2/3 large subunit